MHSGMKFADPELPVAERIRDLVARMTIEEKISQMQHDAPAIPRLGIPEYNWWNECLHGVARAGKATVFPQAIGLAATFNPDLVLRVASAISDEARAKHHQALRQGNRAQYFGLTYWSPNINIFRDPRWGRGHETYGEDPCLTSRMGVAFVRGLQGDHPRYLKVVATPKHYAVHSGPEPKRHSFDARVSRRDLVETYLRAFRACVVEGGAFSVMGAYNRTNGEPCCASATLLGRFLREQWGFRGYVVSDCGAVCDIHQGHRVAADAAEAAAMAVKAGCDLECGCTYRALGDALRRGLVSEADIDRCVSRLMEARIRLGMFDPEEINPWAAIPPARVHCVEHRRLALEAARQSVVMLKNADRLLPLDGSRLRKIAVVGPTAFDHGVLLGNYHGYSGTLTTILEGIVNAASPGLQVEYAKGCELAGGRPADENHIRWVTGGADAIIAVLGYAPSLEGEEGETGDSEIVLGGDRRVLHLPGSQLDLLKKLHATGKPVILVLTGGSPIEIAWAEENIPAILAVFYPGEEGGNAVADVIFGNCNPAGRLPFTVPASLDQLPDFEDYSMRGRTYRFMTERPLYGFGYGLSYTRFRYGNLRITPARTNGTEPIEVRVEVQNIGDMAGDEVVQLYLADPVASVPAPVCHLEGVMRISLGPGEKQDVSFVLQPEQLALYTDDGEPFVEPGEFVVSVGGGQPAAGAGAVTGRFIVAG